MPEYLLLAFSADVWKNDKGESFDCRYLIIKKTDNVKPMVYKCTADAFEQSKNYCGKRVNLSFDERTRINGVSPVEK